MTNRLQRGGFVLGIVVGLLIGLSLALGVALFITKVPVPFINKVPQRTAQQETAETERNRTWDPNAALGGKTAPRVAGAASAAQAASGAVAGVAEPSPAAPTGPFPPAPTAPPPAKPAPAAPAASSARDPAAILSGAPLGTGIPARSTAGGVEAFVYFVQAGAYTRSDEAEQQKAKLAMMGYASNVTERDQAGRVLYRVRIGPTRSREEADSLLQKLQDAGMDSQIVRVER